MILEGKFIVLGITGSIAAYRAMDIARKLTQAGASVYVVMTKSAMEFITPLTFRSITQRPVIIDMFDPESEFAVQHVALAERAEIVVIAPATANIIAKLANGIADDMLSCTVLATQAPVLIAPAMNVHMYENRITQQNISKLKERGLHFVGPSVGPLATGIIGAGRLSDVDDIVGTIRQVLGRNGDLAGEHIVVSAGSTQEPFDPVRYISNRSSGKMGYAIAEAARDRGAKVTLVSGPTALAQPVGMNVVQVRSAQEMLDAIKAAVIDASALIMAAAVVDFRPVAMSQQKIKKASSAVVVELIQTPDILNEVRGDFIRVGFAAESQDLLENARQKLENKNLDLIAANDITATDSGFAVDTNKVILIHRSGEITKLPLMLKSEVADKILDEVAKLLAQKGNPPGGSVS